MSQDSNHSGGHATVKQYMVICVILVVVTFIEYWIFHVKYFRENSQVMVPLLIFLSIGKFILVAGYYMHLKFDNKVLLKIFAVSLVMASLILGVYGYLVPIY